MKRIFFSGMAIVAAVLSLTSGMFAQSISGLPQNESSKSDTISIEVFDHAKYKVFYKYDLVPDSTLIQHKIECQTILLIGDKYEEFMDYNAHQRDSLFNTYTKAGQGALALGEGVMYGHRIKFKPYLIKGYPTQGVALFQDAVMSRNNYRYENKYSDIDWQLHDETKEIQGYQVHKATCDYRGRSYIAWYCPEISISSGPYVFGGLPGLILEIEDSRGHHHFTMNGFQEVKGDNPIYLPNANIIKTTREAVHQMKQNIANDPSLMLKGLSGGGNIDPKMLGPVKPRPYNPIELE